MKNLSFNRSGKRRVLLLSLIFTLISNAFSQNQLGQADLNDFSPVTLPLTETRSFYSEILEREMVLFIKLPATYRTNTQKIYPCWYHTDGNRSFPILAEMANYFEIPVIVEPEIFVVGIGYKIRDMGDWGAWRTRDLTPTNIPSSDTYWAGIFSNFAGREIEVKTGGSAKFLESIEN